ncbi:MAG: hypothetical protein ACE5GR_04805, partial [Nitrosopumilus sp.]
ESLNLNDAISKTLSASLVESLPLDDNINRNIPISLDESLPLDDNINRSILIPLTENLSITEVMETSKLNSISLNEILSIDDGFVDLTFVGTVLLTETLPFIDEIDPDHAATFSLSEALDFSDSSTELVNIGPNQILIEDKQTTIIVTEDNKELVITNSDALLNTIEILADNTVINYTQILTGTNVTITNGWTAEADVDSSSAFDVKVQITNSTTISGPIDWDGLLGLPTFTPIIIPDTETETFSETTAIEIGLPSAEITFDEPVRIEFTGDGGNQGFDTFFKRAGDTSVTFITITCNADDLATVKAQLGGTGECKFDDGSDLIIWTTHWTSFGDSRKSAKSTSSAGPSAGPSGGGGATGTGPSGGIGGFGGILGTPLAINEVSYDRCTENMARILVSSDADEPPSVILHTTRSGTVYATLAEEQPFEEFNQFSRVDKYVYEAPIASDETFFMVVVTEIKGEIVNKVQAPVYLTDCTGSTTIVKLPKEEEISFEVPRIFDVKFQIENGTKYSAESESGLFYLDEQDLTVTAIIDSKSPLERVTLRTITMGQTDEEYVALKMDVEPMAISDSTYFVSATIPSYFMTEPGMKYWIHIFDEDLNVVDSKQYEIGVKPTTTPEISVEMDVPTIKRTGATIKPEVYIFTENNATAYGLVSLIVDGEIVSQRTQLFEAGQTKVTFDWQIPKSESSSSNELQGRVDLYDGTIITEVATLYNHPRTVSILSSELGALEIIEKDGQVLAEPALIYASDNNTELQLRVTDPQGQCVIGGTDDCQINESTKDNRGGLKSILYNDQVLRVRYSGPDNALERFSITSIDPIVGQWSVSLETEDGGFQEAHAIEDTSVKIKYRYHSETITVFSN